LQKEQELTAKYEQVSPEKYYELSKPWLDWFHAECKKQTFYYSGFHLKGYIGERLFYRKEIVRSSSGKMFRAFKYGNGLEYPLWAIYLFETERALGNPVSTKSVSEY
jgi:hypothetical protein